ncbi:hypothetical protein [Streptomyces sp. NRRL WC-3742]|uniref:hypothetical protein n=1 Tax=Streptomyces sp. NRRL WC-3742 TaxID=1463934 RepID=UPI0004CA8AC0|nr:hypothetical protein [Streptomyces sp. NRRL WC-3742]
MESTGLHWLAQVMPNPEAFRAHWERTGLGVMLLPAGRRWDVLSVPGRLGRPALDVLAAGTCGPVLADSGGSRGSRDSRGSRGSGDVRGGYVGFLVPVGTAARWIGTGVRSAGEGTWIAVPHPGRRSRGVRWLVPPDGSGRLNDPVLLELALHEAAAGLTDW